MDLRGAFLELVVGRLSPRARARLAWADLRRRGDAAAAVVEAAVRRDDVVVDAGASWGLFAARLADLVGPGGRVHAFEPNPVNARSLAALGRGRDQLRRHSVALSDSPGSAELQMPRRRGRAVDAMGTLSVAKRREGLYTDVVAVEKARLDDALGADVARVRFLKVDVEGHEDALLEGAMRTLSEAQPLVLIEVEQRHRDVPVSRTFDRLRSLGYTGFAVREDSFIALDDFDLQRDQLNHLRLDKLEAMVPPEYVHDFVFVPRQLDAQELGIAAGGIERPA